MNLGLHNQVGGDLVTPKPLLFLAPAPSWIQLLSIRVTLFYSWGCYKIARLRNSPLAFCCQQSMLPPKSGVLVIAKSLKKISLQLCAKSLQSCLTLCNPMDCNLPDSSVHGILQARTLEWVVMPRSRRSSQQRDQTCISWVSCIDRLILYQLSTWVAFPNMWDSCYYWYGDDFRCKDIALNYIGLHRGENDSLYNLVSILLIISWGMSHFGMKIYLTIPDFC